MINWTFNLRIRGNPPFLAELSGLNPAGSALRAAVAERMDFATAAPGAAREALS